MVVTKFVKLATSGVELFKSLLMNSKFVYIYSVFAKQSKVQKNMFFDFFKNSSMLRNRLRNSYWRLLTSQNDSCED